MRNSRVRQQWPIIVLGAEEDKEGEVDHPVLAALLFFTRPSFSGAWGRREVWKWSGAQSDGLLFLFLSSARFTRTVFGKRVEKLV